MIKHFCDRCDKPLETEDFGPFIRLDRSRGIFISALAVTGQSQRVEDICRTCIIEILTDGEPTTSISPGQAAIIKPASTPVRQITPMPVPVDQVATLQPPSPAVAFDAVQPADEPIYERSKFPETE